MDGWGAVIAGVDAVAREAMLFAAVGFLVGGIDDLTVDVLYLRRRLFVRGPWRRTRLADLPRPATPGRIAVFIGAWDEAEVIGTTLRRALERFDHPDYRLYVGVYPNDPATRAAVSAVAADDARVRLVIGPGAGPTTKADNLNAVWRALLRDEAADGVRVKAVVLHDAEDLVDHHELTVFDALIGDHAAVQLPVEPIVVPGSHLVSGHYCDEFASAHGMVMPVRQAIGAGLPLAGTGCAIARPMLQAIADSRGGSPFDAGSLTEDYELGLEIAARGGRGLLARIERPDGRLVAVRAYFPATLGAAVRQKARWMTGIALAGWDRTGWSRLGELHDHWMRIRDRRGPFAVLVLAAGWLALLGWVASLAAHYVAGSKAVPLTPQMRALLTLNLCLLGWRLLVRASFTARIYGWRGAIWSPGRMVAGNIVSLLAVGSALRRYLLFLRGDTMPWDKTAHMIPEAEG